MFIGYSKISISVIIKHVQHIRITRAFYLPVGFLFACGLFKSFSVPGVTGKNYRLWFTRGDQYPG